MGLTTLSLLGGSKRGGGIYGKRSAKNRTEETCCLFTQCQVPKSSLAKVRYL